MIRVLLRYPDGRHAAGDEQLLAQWDPAAGAVGVRVSTDDDMLDADVCICTVPARQGTHLPHDSSRQKAMKKQATSTIEVVSSITTMPPEPMIEPSSCRLS